MTTTRMLCVALCAVLVWPAAASAQGRYTRAQEDQFHRAATSALAHGAYDEARDLAATRDPADPSAVALLARLDILRGDYVAAESRLEPVAATTPISAAGLELALLQQYLGRRDEANARLNTLVDLLQRSREALDLYRGALAARALGEYQLANSLVRAAALAAPDDPAIQALWGELFAEKYDQLEASKSFNEALALDDQWAPAHLGMAGALADTDPPTARSAAAAALEINPDYLAAHLFLAQRDLDDRDQTEAHISIARALAINDQSLEARSLVAAVAYVEDRLDDFEAEVERVLAINPRYGDVFRVAGDLTARNYRFEEAVALVRRGLAIDPDNTRSYANLGMHLLRTGDEPGARQALERSFAEDPFDVVTFNLLDMLDSLDEFETFEEGDLVVRLHRDEAAVLKAYVLPLAQRGPRRPVGAIRVSTRGPDSDRGVSAPRRLRGSHPRAPGDDRGAGRLLREGGDARLATRTNARRVQLAGDVVARTRARHHVADVEPAGATLADRGALDLRGKARPSGLGARSRSRVRDRAQRGRRPVAP